MLTADGDVTMSGEISAIGGTIGGFDIGGSISTQGVILGNSSEDLFIAQPFKVDHSGNITFIQYRFGWDDKFTSGDVGGFQISITFVDICTY